MKKITISKLFLYRHRFVIGYILIGIAFLVLLFTLPLLAPKGISQAEMQSVIDSQNLHLNALTTGNIVDLPYHALQKLSIRFFGLTPYAIKLPSIIIGLFLGILLILLLNRWFKNNVALFASVLTVLSVPFLYLTGSGTPLIMLVFWPTFLLWLGSKIQGVKKPRPAYCLIFAIALLLSVFTPHLIYLVVFITLFAFLNPHIRFTIKSLPKVYLAITGLLVIYGLAMLGINIFHRTNVLMELFFTDGFTMDQFLPNLKQAFVPFFSWSGNIESVYLSPLINLATIAIAITGLLSTSKGFFASRNSIASYLIFFTVFLSGFNPNSAVLIIIPLAILVAHGLRYILEKWYGLFPENPYARVFGIFPITIFLSIIIISDLSHFVFGYRYSPPVANQFTNDIPLITTHLPENSTLLIEKDPFALQFYQILSEKHPIAVTDTVPKDFTGTLYTLGKAESLDSHFQLTRIITSPKSDNSARIYIYNTTK